jgi:hypothetical protein
VSCIPASWSFSASRPLPLASCCLFLAHANLLLAFVTSPLGLALAPCSLFLLHFVHPASCLLLTFVLSALVRPFLSLFRFFPGPLAPLHSPLAVRFYLFSLASCLLQFSFRVWLLPLAYVFWPSPLLTSPFSFLQRSFLLVLRCLLCYDDPSFFIR